MLLLSAGKKGKGHWAHTLIPYVKILCSEQIPGKLQKALCKNWPLCWQSKKTASPVPIYSHFASAEKEFRFPLGYGNQRPLSATWTVTGAGACILGYEPPPRPDNKTLNTLRNRNICAVITGITTGRLIDFGFRDSLNMGACMAPAACDTIARNLQDFHRKPSDYDAIFTGDLGMVGQTILFDLLTEKGFDISSVHQDCGMLIYDPQTQDTHSGGSGCGCAASVLAGYILPGIIQKKWKRILFVPTGALLSKVSFNEGDPIPGIAHAVVIEQYRVPDMM